MSIIVYFETENKDISISSRSIKKEIMRETATTLSSSPLQSAESLSSVLYSSQKLT